MFLNINKNENSDGNNLSKLYEELGEEVFTQMQNKPFDMDNKVFFENLMESAMNICVAISSELMAPKDNNNSKAEVTVNKDEVNYFDFVSNFDEAEITNGQENKDLETQSKDILCNASDNNAPMNDLLADLRFNNIPSNNSVSSISNNTMPENNLFSNAALNKIPLFCPNCGAKLENGDTFCANCGGKVN